jgi:tight adherence protein C
MAIDLLIALTAAFLLVALLSGLGVSATLSSLSPERRRLRQLAATGISDIPVAGTTLVDAVDPRLKRLPGVPKSPKEMNRLRRRLASAGYHNTSAMFVFGLAKLILPVVFAAPVLFFIGPRRGWILTITAAAFGYLLPGILVSRNIERRKQEIRNGLPDALDLMIVCVEAGCGLDQAIVKASEDLAMRTSRSRTPR